MDLTSVEPYTGQKSYKLMTGKDACSKLQPSANSNGIMYVGGRTDQVDTRQPFTPGAFGFCISENDVTETKPQILPQLIVNLDLDCM